MVILTTRLACHQLPSPGYSLGLSFSEGRDPVSFDRQGRCHICSVPLRAILLLIIEPTPSGFHISNEFVRIEQCSMVSNNREITRPCVRFRAFDLGIFLPERAVRLAIIRLQGTPVAKTRPSAQSFNVTLAGQLPGEGNFAPPRASTRQSATSSPVSSGGAMPTESTSPPVPT